MILYHGSFLEIEKTDLLHSRPNVDFGLGFYTTPLHGGEMVRNIQAKRKGWNNFSLCLE